MDGGDPSKALTDEERSEEGGCVAQGGSRLPRLFNPEEGGGWAKCPLCGWGEAGGAQVGVESAAARRQDT